jgi:hypothetical protein
MQDLVPNVVNPISSLHGNAVEKIHGQRPDALGAGMAGSAAHRALTRAISSWWNGLVR